MTTKLATIYLRKSKLLIASSSKTISGFWVAEGPVQVVDEGDAFAIAAALRIAFERSRSRVPVPNSFSEPIAPLLEAAGVKSWRSFVKDAKSIGASLFDGTITLTPKQRIDRAGNYIPISEKARTVSSNGDLGATVAETFADAR